MSAKRIRARSCVCLQLRELISATDLRMGDRTQQALSALVEGDGIFLGPRPGKKSMNTLTGLNLSHCCTLLSAREDVRPIEKICESLGATWVWLPIDGGKLEILRQVDLNAHMETLAQSIGEAPKPRVYFHCSAGIHRTGFFVYALLRIGGLKHEEAHHRLRDLRGVTADQVGEDRLALADEMIASLGEG